MCAAPLGGAARGQSGYYNLDGGRPTRVEDAVPTARHELEIQLPTLRLERFDDGTLRWRIEPKLALGLLPFTEIELRLPILRVLPRAPAPTSTGIASVGLGVLHALNLETQTIPAFALAGELGLPVGSLAAPRSTYAFKALASKTFSVGRLQINAGGGSWNVRAPASRTPTNTCGTGEPGVPPCEPPPFPPDVPCAIVPLARAAMSSAAQCGSEDASGAARAVSAPRLSGMRWMAGIGVDRAFALQSMLVAADFVIERFYGLYDLSDWTAEVGVRRQLTPQLVADFGLGRRLHGVMPATTVTLGFSYGVATSFLRGLSGGGE